MSQWNCFIATNTIYKKYHYYPCAPLEIRHYFESKKLQFDPREGPSFSGEDLTAMAYVYWCQLKGDRLISYFLLPQELYWLAFELDPTHWRPKYLLPLKDINNFDKGD